jgi:hypothetical protein
MLYDSNETQIPTVSYTATVKVWTVDSVCVNAALLNLESGIFYYAYPTGDIFLHYQKYTNGPVWDSTNTVKIWKDISVDSIIWEGWIPIKKGLEFPPFLVVFDDTLDSL